MLACGGRFRAARGVQLADFAFVRKRRGRVLVRRARAWDDSDPSFDTHSNGAPHKVVVQLSFVEVG